MGERDGLKVDGEPEPLTSGKAEGVAPGAGGMPSYPGRPRRTEQELLSTMEVCPSAPPCQQENVALTVPKRLNLVLEGGGLRGIALVGAIRALADELIECEQYKDTYISYLAGTSAGSIIAALLGAGYTPSEITDILNGPEIARFAEPTWLSGAPFVGKYLDLAVNFPKGIWNVLTKLGFIKGDYLLGYIRALLHAKRIRSFGDLIMPGCAGNALPEHRYRVHLIASDITRGRMITLPDDINPLYYGVEPDDLDVALAVRMSMSFPFVFQPVRLKGDNGVESYIVDGGVLSNFPIGLFDRGAGAEEGDETLTLGIKLLQDRYNIIKFPFFAARALYALGSTAIGAHDVSNVVKAVDRLKWARVLEINTEAVPIFKLGPNPLGATPTEKEVLYNAGYRVTRRAIQANFLERAVKAHEIAAQAAKGLPRGPSGAEAQQS
jgi:NTE family protein